MTKRLTFPLLFACLCNLQAQDSLYTRQVLKTLSSEKYYGRGYVRGGLKKAERFITSELTKSGCRPLFGESFHDEFRHQVNTFPSTAQVSINGQALQCGRDYIPGAENPGINGCCSLQRTDSVTFGGVIGSCKVLVKLKEKLTYTVGRKTGDTFVVELDRKLYGEEPRQIRINFKNRLVRDFCSYNIGCYLPGTSGSDTMVVFTAHYDHLGGIGRHTFFPGANDNASGVSMVLNLVKFYARNQPRYKTVFIFFAGEEAGLLGSEHFVLQPAIDLGKIRFLINLDLLGTGDEGIMVVNGAILPEAFSRLEKINADKNLLPQIKKRGKAANSDHYWFTEKGVPTFFIYTMGGIKAYHDVYDREETLPLTKYKEVFNLLTSFAGQL